MGYKTPLVCKEIYLPYESSITAEAYKEKYGIDLNDIFEAGSNEEPILKDNIKLYVVTQNGDKDATGNIAIGKGVFMMNIYSTDNDISNATIMWPLFVDGSASVGKGRRLAVTFLNGKVTDVTMCAEI